MQSDSASTSVSNSKKPGGSRSKPKKLEHGFEVIHIDGSTVFELMAEDDEDADAWVEAISQAAGLEV